MDKNFFIIDGHALTYRSFFAFKNNPRINSKGFNTSAIYGFANILITIIKKEKPSHICVVFDTKEPTWRKKIFTDYKANRPKQPQEITDSFPYIKDFLDALNIHRIEIPGYEADDIIGTLSNIYNKEANIYIMTPDKDYDQLVQDNVFIYKPQRHSFGYEIITLEKVINKWGINNTAQVVDMLALIGDDADNIPGLPGVGEKTAAKLISQYGSIENIYDNIKTVTTKLQSLFINNKEQLFLSKNLAKIDCSVPLETNINKMLLKSFNMQKLEKIFNILEFKSLFNKFSFTTQENSYLQSLF